ncbi:hypothetical protein KBZ12_11285 [Cyanobium sp. Cruz CV13-4-11]|jgi:hypothetical protein|nr:MULTISPECIES: hypothetical protein [unclassified Cyanobium]MCP9901029.1 hypothetical protein [Cyanobium sp. Cruz CV11-17]MCP9920049.1 hypothetical protein [Cyanobium sp. Cruz CV13-4-11]
MNLPTALKSFGWLEAWMSEKKNVIRFLLGRLLLMTAMVLAFCVLHLPQT